MFGRKKKKEQQEAARAAAVAERAEALAAFEKRAADIDAMTDMGEKLFALEKFGVDLEQKITAEGKRLETNAGNNSIQASNLSGVLFFVGGLSAIAVGVTSAPAIIPLAGGTTIGGFAIMAAGVLEEASGTMKKKIDKLVANKRKKAGIYDDDFVNKLDAMAQKSSADVQDILSNRYDALSQSKVFNDVTKSYPSIKNAFADRALKAAETARANQIPTPPRPGSENQGFTF